VDTSARDHAATMLHRGSMRGRTTLADIHSWLFLTHLDDTDRGWESVDS